MKKVIIAGCCDFGDYKTLKERSEYYLQNKINTHNVIIVSGHALGIDSLGERFAQNTIFNVRYILLNGTSMNE